jgi:iron(III) transport system ATP-binding protein
MTETAIQLDGVGKRFGVVRAVADASLAVEAGEVLALLGPSGCGKTTLLRLVAGFEAPDEGAIAIAGQTVSGRGAWVPPERRRVGMVFQDYALFPHLTVAENVGYGLARRARPARVAEVMRLVGLDGLDRRYPGELSGGQQQRVALARSLAPEPRVLLLDEPWSNIDPMLRAAMREELAGILRAAGATVLVVTHDREEAFSLADRIALMRDGEILQVGVAEDVYFAPSSRWAAEFVGPANFLRGRLVGDRVETVLGPLPALTGAVNGGGPEAMLRPEAIRLEPSAGGPAEVVGRDFRGHDVLYRVRMGDGTVLLSQRPSTELVALGSRVTVHRA